MADDTEPGLTPGEITRLGSLKAKVKGGQVSEFHLKPEDEKNSLLELFRAHSLPNESARRLTPKSENPVVASAENILLKEKAEIIKERRQKTVPEEETDDIRDEIALLTIEVVNKLAADPEAIHFNQASQSDPTSWQEFSRKLQTDQGPLTLRAEIDPQNHVMVYLNYSNSYLDPTDDSLRFVDGTFVSNDDGEFSIIQDVKNYDTGKEIKQLHEFSLSDRTIKRDALEAAFHAQEMLDSYLEKP